MKKLNELQSYLTRLRGLMLTLIILCSIGSGNVWGAPSVISYNQSTKDTETAVTSSNISSGTAGKVSWTATSATWNTKKSRWDIAVGGTLTFTVQSGYVITQIVATTTSNKGTFSVSPSATITGNGSSPCTISDLSASSVTITISGQTHMINNSITVTYEASGGGSSCSECTYYVYNGTTWVSIGTTGFDDVVLAPPTLEDNGHGAGNGCWVTDKTIYDGGGCTYSPSGDKYRYVPNPGGAEPDADNKPGSGTCELYAVYFNNSGCLSTTVTAVQCARIWEEPDNLAVSSVSSTGATLSWDAIAGVSSYHVIVTKVSNSSIVFDGNVNGTSKSLTGLTSGTEYSWKVAANSATNDACDSNFSDGDNFTTCASGFTSLTPTVTADNTGKNGGEALFELSGATSYSVTLKNNSTNAVIAGYNNVSNTSGDITFSGLTASTTYRVEVIAHNACGDNSQTGSETFTTDAATLYTVTFHNAAGSAPSAVAQTTENGTVSIPNASACEGWTFVGWKVGGSQSEVTSDPTGSGTWITSNSWPKSYTPTGNIDAYAVFSKTEGGGPVGFLNYTEVTSNLSDWSGKYVLYDGTHIATGTFSSNSLTWETASAPSSTEMTAKEFTLTKITYNENTYYTLQNASGTYIGVTSANSSKTNLVSGNSASTTHYYWTPSTSYIQNLGSSRYLGDNQTSAFKAYVTSNTSTNTPAKLYKRNEGSTGTTTWRSDPPCCEKLAAVGGTWTTANNIAIDGTNITVTVKAGNIVTNASGYRFVLYNEAGTSEIAHKDVNSNSAPVSTTFTSSDGVALATNYKVSVITLGDGSTYCDEGNESSKIAANVPSAATWTVTYNKNTTEEVTGMPASPLEVLQATGSGTLSDATPTRTGYTFGGWSNTFGSGNTADYSAGGTISGVTADKTIYAVWTAKPTYTITLNAGNGTISDGSWTAGVSPTWTQTQAHGDASITFPTASCNCAGWVFQGWKLGSAADDQSSFTPDQTEGSSLVPMGNVTYYAVYRQNSTGGTTYNKITDIGDLTTGTYVIKTSGYAMKNTYDWYSSGGYYHMGEESNSGSDASITNTSAAIAWTIIKFGSNYAIKNGSNFVGIDGDGLLVYDETMHLFTAAYDGTNNGWVFTSTENTSYQLVYNYYYRSLDTQSTAILLYKQGAGLSGNYYTNPVCSDYTVTGVANPAAGGSVTLSATSGKTGDKIYAYYTKDPAYNFENWSVSGTGATLSSTTDQYTELTIGTADVTLTANFVEKVMYSVSWVVNNAPYSTGTPSSSIEGGSKWSALTLPTAPADNTLSDCDRTKFVGWSTSTLTGDGNSAPSDLFKTTSDANADSHTITGNTTFYAVFAKGGGDTNWQITGDDIDILDPSGNSTYTKRNGDHTKSGITFNTSQVTTNNSQLQFQASAGVLYNKTAMPENITSIVLTTNALKVYQKSTVISSTAGLTDITPTGTGPYTYTFDDGNKYFCVKKTTSGAGYSDYLRVNYAGSSTDYVTSCACSWQINYITNGKDDGEDGAIWSEDNCFLQVGETHEWQIENFAMPNVAGQFWVGPGYFKGPGDWGHSVIADLSTVKYVRRSDKFRTDYSAVSNMIGTLNIWDNGGDDNYHVGIYPDYQITYGVDGGGDPWTKVDFNYISGTTYETEVVTAPTYFAVANFKYYVGVKTDGNTGWGGKSSTVLMNTMSGMTTNQNGKNGKWRMYEDSNSANWYCAWVPYYVLSYDANGGTGAPSAEAPVSSEGDASSRTKTVSSTVPTRDGYTFLGWAESTAHATAGTVDYTAGNNIILTADKTIYAVWAQNFTVTYDLDGGTASPACLGGTYYVGQSVTVCSTTPTKTSSSFLGWKRLDTDATVAGGSTFTMPSNNVTIQAQWETVYFHIYYKEEDGTAIATDDVPQTAETTLRNQTPCVGYTFFGWSTSKITTETTTKPSIIDKGGAKYTPEGDITVYPVYARVEGASDKNDVITKDINGGSGSYTAFSNVSYVSDAKYAGCTIVQGSTDLSWNATNGIVTTTSGGRIKHVQVVFATGCTQPRSLYVYGKNTAYSTFVQNGFPTGVSVGTKIATATKTTAMNTGEVTVELPGEDEDFEDEYNYIALGADNSLRLTSVKITWSTGTTYYATHCETKTDVTVTYNGNGGTVGCGSPADGAITSVTWDYKNSGADAPELASAQTICASATRSGGYILRDWTTSQDGSGTHYNPGQTVTSMDGDKTLYAQWDRVYTVTFNNQGTITSRTQASGGASVKVPNHTTPCTDEEHEPDEYTWTFAGWSTTPSLSNSLTPNLVLNATTGAYNADYTPSDDITLYAVYQKTVGTSPTFQNGKTGAYYISAVNGSSSNGTVGVTHYAGTKCENSSGGFNCNGTTNPSIPVYFTYHEAGTYAGYYTIQASDGQYLGDGAWSNSPVYLAASAVSGGWDFVFYGTTRHFTHSAYFRSYASLEDPLILTPAPSATYFTTMTCASAFDMTFNMSSGVIDYGSGSSADYLNKPDGTVISTFPTATLDGWTFIGWTAGSQYNDLYDVSGYYSDQNSSNIDPISDPSVGGAIYGGIYGGTAYTMHSDIVMYPVFTKLEDNNAFDEINGGDYYIYYLADYSPISPYSQNDRYAGAHRVYATGFTGAVNCTGTNTQFTGTMNCENATVFTFTKLANGNWTIYDNTKHGYVTGKSDNGLQECTSDDTGWSFVQSGSKWILTYTSGKAFIANDLAHGATSAEFQNFNISSLTSQPTMYHYVYIGSCTERIFSSNPSTTPEIDLKGTAVVTASQNGAVRGTNVLTVSGHNLTPTTGEITITSNNSDVYFSKTTAESFAAGIAAASNPQSSITVTANGSGIVTPTSIYVHYKPSSNTDAVTDVTVTATSTGATDATTTIKVRCVKENFAIAAKVGDSWYALPANMSTSNVYAPTLIEVDETNKIAYGPSTVAYKMWPVKTTNGGGNRYGAAGDLVRFAGNSDNALWANNAVSGTTTGIRNWAVVNSLTSGGSGSGEDVDERYEWVISTEDGDAYTLNTNQSNNKRNLVIYRKNGQLVWATNGTYVTNELHLIPLTERATITIIPREWKTNGFVFMVNADNLISAVTYKIGTGDEMSTTYTRHSTGGYGLYEVALPDLTSHYGKTLTLKMTISGVATYAYTTIPIIVSGTTTTTTAATPFTTLGTASKDYDVVILEGAKLTTNATTDGAYKFQNFYVYSGATWINDNASTSLGYLELRGGIKGVAHKSDLAQGVPHLMLNKQITSTAGANLDMSVNVSHSYALSVPFDVTVSSINYVYAYNLNAEGAAINAMLDKHYLLMEYDGAQRASTGKGWKHITSTSRVLHAGEGYVLQAKRPTGQPFAVIRIPFSGVGSWADSYGEGGKSGKSAISITANNGGANTPENDKGWNLIANPYMATLSYNGQGETWAADFKCGTLTKHPDEEHWDGTYQWTDKTNVYITMPNDWYTEFPQYRANSSYAVFEPFKNFFIQTESNGSVTFDKTRRATMPRYLMAQTDQADPIYADINLTHGEDFAQAGIVVDANATTGYKFGEDYGIFEARESLNYLKVYTVADGHYLVGNTLTPAETAELIPLEFYAPNANGEYVFSLDEGSDIDRLEYVILYDAELNINTNLLTGSYAVELDKTGLIENRFSIGLKIKEEEHVTTGTGDVDDEAERPFKFIHNDKMYILRNGKLYDATGKMVREINK